jgi:protein-S-isoprenylcysteine O-methyltransferase Ste14
LGALRYVKGFVLEPLLGILVVPAIVLLLFSEIHYAWLYEYPIGVLATVTGILLTGIGIVLVTVTTYLFAKIGKGSAAPWDPPTDLVVHGIYRYVRNPMVLGVLFTVLGEVVLFGSFPLLLLFLFLLVGNHILFVKQEEPELSQRFGEDYLIYMESVPRWIPRRTPWTPLTSQQPESKESTP